MPKTHIVREAFSLDGKDYPRGTEITDPVLLDKIRASHVGHVIPQHHEAPAAVKAESKPDLAAPKA